MCTSTAGDARTSDCVRASVGTSGFSRGEALSFGWSDLEEEGSWDDEDTAEGGSNAGLGGEVEVETEEDVDRTADGEEVEDGLGAA